MKLEFPKIVLGRDLCGMQIALQKDAIFIPISFLSSFGWETLDENIPAVTYLRSRRNEKFIERRYQLITKDKPKDITCFLWEIEELYKFLLFSSNKFHALQSNITCYIKNENTAIIVASRGICLEIKFQKCWVVNPEDSWFRCSQNITESIEGETSHLIYTLFLSKETEDMKGISFSNDIEDLDNEFFSKIWYGPLFGPRKFLVGNDVKRKKPTLTTRYITLLKENVSKRDIDLEEYSIAEVRKEIYRLLAPRHKRISDRILSFDKEITKVELSSKLDIYKSTDSLEFVYYTDKKEILCQKNLDYLAWPQSYPRILMSQLTEIMNLM